MGCFDVLDIRDDYLQPIGWGGYGCRSRTLRTLPGGAPGTVYFVDRDTGNNFYGLGFDINRRRIIRGEAICLLTTYIGYIVWRSAQTFG